MKYIKTFETYKIEPHKIHEILIGYLNSVIYTEQERLRGENGKKFTRNDISAHSVNMAENDIKTFIDCAGEATEGMINGELGHNIWYARNHNHGFSNNDFRIEIEKKLISCAQNLGKVLVYLNEHGEICFKK